MQERLTCTGCFRHADNGEFGVLLIPVQYAKGLKSGAPVPYPDIFQDGKPAKWACWDCWECWEVLEYAQQGYDAPILPEDIERVSALRHCAGCLDGMGLGCCGVIVTRVEMAIGGRSGRLQPYAEIFDDGIGSKVICADCWPWWEVMEDGPGYPEGTNPMELLESAMRA